MPHFIRKTIPETFLARVKATPSLVGFQYRSHIDGEWTQVTYGEFYQRCERLSLGLQQLGVGHGDRVAILSSTRFEWALTDMAVMCARAVTVPIYPSNSPHDVAFILNHSGAKVVLVEDHKQLDKVILKRESLPELKHIVVMDPAFPPDLVPSGMLNIKQLEEKGDALRKAHPQLFEQTLLSVQPDDLFTICYTSGTTGTPKGAMLAHDSMASVMEDGVAALGYFIRPEKEILITFLPFSHILGRVESLLTYTFGWRQCYLQSLDRLMVDIGEVRPTVFFAVPRIFEKAQQRIHAMALEGSPLRRRLFQWASRAGRVYYKAGTEKRGRISLQVRASFAAARYLVFNRIKKRFGGRLRLAVCGGAPLPREVGEFFRIAGITIIEGYGLTETCGPCTIGRPERVRFGSVGLPLADVQFKIAQDGEILIQSRKLFRGYYKMPNETAETMQDGWYHTGDIGHIDADGFVHITDRKKDLIVTSGGKNIAPQKIENLLHSNPVLEKCMVYGDRRNYLTALVTLNAAYVQKYAADHGLQGKPMPELVNCAEVRLLVDEAIQKVNGQLASFETIKKYCILPNEFSVETGELTPSLKVKRGVVAQKYKEQLDQLYPG